MDSNSSTITRSFNRSDHEKRKEPMTGIDRGRDHINYYTSLSEIHNTNEKHSNPYSPNSCGKQVIIKRGRPRKHWPESRQNMYDHQTCYKSKHDGQIPSFALATQPRKDQCQDQSEKTLIQRNEFSSRSKTAAERHEITRHLETIESDRIRKQASRHVDIPLSEPRHSLCSENELCYPTRTQIGSAFTPARGPCYKPCCHGNIQKYSEPYFWPCYPLMIPEEQVTSPRLDRDICYHTTQLPNYSLAKQSQMTARQSSSKNPIIIDCFSLAINENMNEQLPVTDMSQESSVARYQYEEEEEDKETGSDALHQNKFQHNCMICQQIATGEMLPQLCNTSVKRNKCCYQTSQTNSRCTTSSKGNIEDESPESCWDNTSHDTIQSEDQEKKTTSPEEVGFKQEHEECDSQEVFITINEDRRTVINSAFSHPNEKKSKSNVYESNLQVLRRQETRISAETEQLDDDTQEALPSHPSHYYTSTNTQPLYSTDNKTDDTRKSLQRKLDAMYDILDDPDKTSKKSYFCSHCGRAFTHLSSLNNHIRTHTGQKPFRCRYCGKRFAQSGVLTAHLRTHTGEKPFNCVLCGKRFAQTTTLANHIRTHTGQKPFSCRYCKRTFAQSSTRNKHELSHTKEKPFECKYCGRSFTQSATVMRHMRIHMRDTKYSCVHCGKTFAYLYSLDKHLDEHT